VTEPHEGETRSAAGALPLDGQLVGLGAAQLKLLGYLFDGEERGKITQHSQLLIQNGSALSRSPEKLTRSAFASSLRGVARAARKPKPDDLTVHQVVAHNVYQARKLRGWTQEEAAAAISETLGRPITAAGLSAIEKTFTSRRQRVIDVAELTAFARAFGVPIAWFFLPPERRETSAIPGLYEHAATMAVDVFGDEDAWQWYLARIVDLLGAPNSILHDDLLGSAGYPSSAEWAEIDRKREELLKTALAQFAADNSAVIETLIANLTKLLPLTATRYTTQHAPKPDDPFGYLNDRVSIQRVQHAGGITFDKRPEPSGRYRPKKRPN
jgi:transcriptional regulator with XRE-family HTH domain